MKYILLSLIFLLNALFSFSQIHSGSLLLGGNIGFSVDKNEMTNPSFTQFRKIRSYALNPSLGYAIKENTVIGAALNYGSSKNKGDSYKTTGTVYGGQIYYRRFLNLGRNFLLYGEGAAGYAKEENKAFSNSNIMLKTRQTGASLNLSAGISYLAGKRFLMEIGLNRLAGLALSKSENIYPSNQQENTETNTWEAFGSISGNTPLTIGFRFLLGNK